MAPDRDRIVIDDHAAFGQDTVITLADGDTVVLQGVAFASFHADRVVGVQQSGVAKNKRRGPSRAFNWSGEKP
jgi:hypothetical protein